MPELVSSPLRQFHQDSGAKFIDFAGWELPLVFPAGSRAEHHAVRRSGGVFDVSHMARFWISGPGADAFMHLAASAPLLKLSQGFGTYLLLLAGDGGIIDDAYAFRLPEGWYLVSNGATRTEVATHLQELAETAEVTRAGGVAVEDRTRQTFMVAVQGPMILPFLSAEIAALGGIARNEIRDLDWNGNHLRISRTGYTGEDGVEIAGDEGSALDLISLLMQRFRRTGAELQPCGLASRDSLRFEAGFHLYGTDMDRSTSPVEVSLKWVCDLKDPDHQFHGRAALEQRLETDPRRMALLVLDESGVPRHGYPVLKGDRRVGEVTSGMYCPTIDVYAANVLVERDAATRDGELSVDIRGRARSGHVTRRPLYQAAYRE